MVKKKGKSKRTTLQDKYKIQRRVTETHRKARKAAKRDAKNGIVRHGNKSKKDPGIPNSWPFKQDLLNEIGRARDRAQQAALEKKKNKNNNNKNSNNNQGKTLEDLMGQVAQTHAEYALNNNSMVGATAVSSSEDVAIKDIHGQPSRRAYLRECRKVLDQSDVILQVVDARDPMGTRIGKKMEEMILSRADKKMVLVMNKVDLIPKSAVSGWLTYLRKSHPAIAVKAGKNAGGQAKGDSALLNSSSAVGMEGVLQLLKNYARNQGVKSKGCITVGIIGYPNVGKSSIINSLKRARAVGVSARPGFTTCAQEVVLDKNIRLVDCPGVVFDDDVQEEGTSASVLLRNCVDIDTIDDPIPVMQELVNRCTRASLMMTYAIPAFPEGNAEMFLAMVAKKLGKVKKGGIPDKVMAARVVLRDWNSGKIPYFTPPPLPTSVSERNEMMTDDADNNNDNFDGSVTVVNEFGKQFDVELMKNLKDDRDEMDFVQLNPVSHHLGSEQTTKFLVSEDVNNTENDMDMESTNTSGFVDNAGMADAEDYDFSKM